MINIVHVITVVLVSTVVAGNPPRRSNRRLSHNRREHRIHHELVAECDNGHTSVTVDQICDQIQHCRDGWDEHPLQCPMFITKSTPTTVRLSSTSTSPVPEADGDSQQFISSEGFDQSETARLCTGNSVRLCHLNRLVTALKIAYEIFP